MPKDRNYAQVFVEQALTTKNLSKNECHHLIEQTQNGCETSRETVINAYRKIIAKYILCYQHEIDAFQLISDGLCEISRCIDQFDQNNEKGASFTTYLRANLERALYTTVQHERAKRGLKISIHHATSYEAALNALKKEGNLYPEDAEIAEMISQKELNKIDPNSKLVSITPEEVAQLRSAITKPLSNESFMQEREGFKLEDRYIEPHQETPESLLIKHQIHKRLKVNLMKRLKRILKEREYYIITQRYIKEKTLQILGDELGISRERVRQIEAHAMKKIRQRLKHFSN